MNNNLPCTQKLAFNLPEYFKTKFYYNLSSTIKSFKATRFFLPKKVGELELTAAELDTLSSLSFLGVNEVASLKSVLHIYFAAVESISSGINPLKCWHNTAKLPNWVSAFRKVALMQPSLAAA